VDSSIRLEQELEQALDECRLDNELQVAARMQEIKVSLVHASRGNKELVAFIQERKQFLQAQSVYRGSPYLSHIPLTLRHFFETKEVYNYSDISTKEVINK